MSEMIPEAAVEAAAKVMFDKRDSFENIYTFEQEKDDLMDEARAILEAAAMHIAAQAWDEGKSAGWDAARGEPEDSNPYEEDAK